MRPLLGISRCLLGDRVRYNGGHKRDDWLVTELGRWVDWHPVCPEVEMGLGVPRESMQLRKNSTRAAMQLIGVRTGENFTRVAQTTCARLAQELPVGLNGFVLKNRSPSCGVERVKVYDRNDDPSAQGSGFFARALLKAAADLPVIEEGALNRAQSREHFVVRIFGHHAVNQLAARMAEIRAFHQAWEFVLLAHHEPSLRTLGRLVANSKRDKPSLVLERYRRVFLRALVYPPNNGKRTNAIQWLYGKVEQEVPVRARPNLLRKLEEYRRGVLSYAALVTLMNRLLAHNDDDRIHQQMFFSPYPDKLRLAKRVGSTK